MDVDRMVDGWLGSSSDPLSLFYYTQLSSLLVSRAPPRRVSKSGIHLRAPRAVRALLFIYILYKEKKRERQRSFCARAALPAAACLLPAATTACYLLPAALRRGATRCCLPARARARTLRYYPPKSKKHCTLSRFRFFSALTTLPSAHFSFHTAHFSLSLAFCICCFRVVYFFWFAFFSFVWYGLDGSFLRALRSSLKTKTGKTSLSSSSIKTGGYHIVHGTVVYFNFPHSCSLWFHSVLVLVICGVYESGVRVYALSRTTFSLRYCLLCLHHHYYLLLHGARAAQQT